MARQFAAPVELENPEPANSQTVLPAPARARASGVGRAILIGGVLLSLFWIGTSVAFVWGWLGFFGLAAQPTSTLALIAAAIILPPFLFLATAVAIARSAAMSEATHLIIAASERLFAADETAANNAARLARLVRRELDGLNNGLDSASNVSAPWKWFWRNRSRPWTMRARAPRCAATPSPRASVRKASASRPWATGCRKPPAGSARPWRAGPRNCVR
jgi:hypothetical protein